MKKTLAVFALGIMFLISLGFVAADKPECTGNPGAIWTTTYGCGTPSQDVNQYAVGEKVYINGAGFCPGEYNWTITGQPGGASCDPNIIVATATPTLYTVDSSGAFCFEAYTVQANDIGCDSKANVYNVEFNGKGDNYHVNENLPVVPEFGTIVGITTILGALGVFFLVRRK